MSEKVGRVWVGIDAGKGHHWAVALDEGGRSLFSTKVVNDEGQIRDLIALACEKADEVMWAVDISGRSSALLLALLLTAGQKVVYVPGRTVNRMTAAYRGEGKTDAKDARVIADQVRMRSDFTALEMTGESIPTLRLLTHHRADLVADRVRLVNRLRDLLLGISPALERAFDWSASKGALTLLIGYQTPAAIREAGIEGLTGWLADRKVRNPRTVADKAVEAAQAQSVVLPGEQVAAGLVAKTAAQLLELDQRIKDNDRDITATFRADPRARIIESMPGLGPILGAELLAITGDLTGYPDAGRLASHAGLAPVPRDSGRRTGNFHRPKHYNRRLRWVFYMSAQTAMMRPGLSRDYYLKKRGEGLIHTQALLALARRRVDVLWAMLRDMKEFTPNPAAHTA